MADRKGLSATLLRNACSTALIGRADRDTPVSLSLVVEPLCKASNPISPHHLQKNSRKGSVFVNGGVENLYGI